MSSTEHPETVDPTAPPNEATPSLRAERDINIATFQTINYGEHSYAVQGQNPYLGLQAFTYAERERYAGREQAVQTLVQRLVDAHVDDRFLLIVGASGCGKSSFVRAGLIPKLEEHYQQRDITLRCAIIDRPGHSPEQTIRRAIERLAALSDQTGSDSPSPQALLIDQFEDVFAEPDHTQQQAVLDLIVAHMNSAQSQLLIIATLRIEFLPQLLVDHRLDRAEQRKVVLRAMTRDELEAAIKRPLEALYGKTLAIDPALVKQLAADAAKDAALLPLLQVTLTELWNGKRMRQDAYSTLADAIQQRADLVYQFWDYNDFRNKPRTNKEQKLIRDLLLELVRISIDESHPPVRWSRARAELIRACPDYQPLISDLASARLLRTDRETWKVNDSEVEVETVAIIHEALLKNWPMLAQAIKDYQAMLLMRARFNIELSAWRTNQDNAAYLLHGIRLVEARSLQRTGDSIFQQAEAQRFFDLSLAADRARANIQQTANSRLIWLVMVVGVLALAVPVFLVYQGILQNMARGELVFVTGGTAWIGSDTTPYENERPPWQTAVADFFMERYKVTTHQYRLCVQAWQACQEPTDTSRYTKAADDLPIVNINAYQASIYCRWLGRRLPTEIEWEWAARGATVRTWPWGEQTPEPSRALLNYTESFTGTAESVYLRPAGATPALQIYQLVGNVMEWTTTPYQAYRYDPAALVNTWNGDPNTGPQYVVLRGSSYKSLINQSHASARIRMLPGDSRPDLGFRCVADR